MDALELAAGDGQVAALLGAAGKDDRIVAAEQLGDVEVDADMDAGVRVTPSADI